MQDQLKGLAVALAAASVTAACGLVGSPPNQPPARAGHITIGGNTRQTEHVSCTQDQWAFTIQADAPPGRARAFLQLGEQKPIVKRVNIENIDGLNGTASGNLGDAKASTDGDIYTLAGTVVGSTAPTPANHRNFGSDSRPRAKPVTPDR